MKPAKIRSTSVSDNCDGSSSAPTRVTRNVSKSTAITTIDDPASDAVGHGENNIERLLSRLESRIMDKIDLRLRQHEERFSSKVNELLNSYDSRLTSLEETAETLTNKVSTALSLAKSHNKLLDSVNFVRRSQRLTDIVIRGVPKSDTENTLAILRDICKVIDHNLSPYAEAFRVVSKNRPQAGSNSSKSNVAESPIIARFSCTSERNSFFTSLRTHRRMKLSDLSGFASDSPIRIFESLTPENNHLFRLASNLQKKNKIHSTFTKNGLVYIKEKRGDPAVRIDDASQLAALPCADIAAAGARK